jgi:serine/threonine protein kinase
MLSQGNRSTVELVDGWVIKTPAVVKELEQELLMLRALQGWEHSPNLHPDYLNGEHPNICMEYIKSHSLKEYILTGEEDAASEILQEVHCTLVYLEDMRIIHADLHPDNILVRPKGLGWKVDIIDYGWAYFADDSPDWIINEGLPGHPGEVRENLVSTISNSTMSNSIAAIADTILL